MTSPATPLAGDFLGLLDRSQLPPLRPDAAAPAAAYTQATTVFAFRFSEGVLMAGDRRATAGNVIVTDAVEKVLEIDDSTLLAVAGVPATAFEMARVLQTSFEYYRRSQLQPLSLPARVRALAGLLRDNVPMALQGVGMVVPLFAGIDNTTEPPEPRIYFYDPLGAQFQAVHHAASGSGSATIRSILAFEEQYGSPRPAELGLDAAIRFALRLLMTAAQFDSATGGVNPAARHFATIKVLRPTGVESISDDRQAAALEGGSRP